MTPRDSVLLVVAKIAQADGRIDEAERAFIAQLIRDADSPLSVEALLAIAEHHSLEEAAQAVSSYPDRFTIALQAYLMAFVDWDYDGRERDIFATVARLLAIEPDDVEIIRATEQELRAPEPSVRHPRIVEMLARSALFNAHGAT